MSEVQIEHDEAAHRWVARLPAGRGELVYHVAGPGVLDLLHTEVDPSLRGQGIAEALVAAAVADARATGSHLVASCPYVQRWLAKHPDAQDLFVARR